MSFRDRIDAGRRLGDELAAQDIEGDLVLAIPRGGLPLGRAVADALDLPLDVVVARKIGAPNNPEYAIGAVASNGSVWLNEAALETLSVDEAYLERQRAIEADNAGEKAERYRGDRDAPAVSGRSVVVVDDGVATGSTVQACIQQLKEAGVARIVLAVPVGAPQTVDELETVVDELVCLETPQNFRAVGQFYDRFEQVSDEDAMAYLNQP